ncbi:MAG: glucose 1-dehydrogenase [Actinomycetota bacterium]|jgi:NAD(P)-dependent dehydrogenase (short-subunit alcohol dehydrogenase family)|nr:glucose 1-dehydrogenase [Actinomycetota bacterium]
MSTISTGTQDQSGARTRLHGKVAVITGAASGIGREAALLFSHEGAKVVVADTDHEAGTRTASECADAIFQDTDVSDPTSVSQLFDTACEHYGGVDILYNNAGIMPADDDSVLITSPEAWDRVQAVNTKGVFLCCRYGIPRLIERGGGSVINVSSFVALAGSATSQISYTASKGAVLAMSRELAVQFARQSVRVNALCPGPVETPLLMRLFEENPDAYERRRVHLPMGRLATPLEIANAALFLASDESSYVNGATFVVDGGLTAAYVTPE